ncbi:MAG: Gx transporter family protein [Candidatus Ozemobacteraceae bacterium]
MDELSALPESLNRPLIQGYTRGLLARWTLLATLGAAAAAIQVIEAPLPRLLPWIKPGLSNALILYGLIRLSIASGIGIVLIRTLLSGLALGILFSPAHFLSFAGGIASTLTMAFALRISGRTSLGLSGISIAGAIANNLAQLWTVEWMFAGRFPLWFNLSLMIWVAIPAGLIVARITDELLRRT